MRSTASTIPELTDLPPVFGKMAPGAVYKPRLSVYAVALDAAGRVGAVLNPSGLSLPGGGLKAGETLEEALGREVLEESGHSIRILRPLGEAVEYVYTPLKKKNFVKYGAFFAVEFTEVAPEGRIDENHSLVWLFPDAALKAFRHGSHRWALRRALAVTGTE